MPIRTVEKIGGTSMSRFDELIDPLFRRHGEAVTDRLFVVSAYGGITDLLLEHKHSGEPGVFAMFSEGEVEDAWHERLDDVGHRMKSINHQFFEDPEIRRVADKFVNERIEDARQCLSDVQRICSFGPFEMTAYLTRVRELLSSIGEAHSAHNASLMLQQRGLNARFIDLTGWRDSASLSLDERLQQGLALCDPAREIPVLTGYAQCEEGLVSRFNRGYTEYTMAKVADIVRPEEAIIHKEYHLSSADPKVVPEVMVSPIGQTNYDVADQLANLGMEAIHPSAGGILRKAGIPLRVKHAFEPEHAGTIIDSVYQSEDPMVEIIAGRRSLTAIEIFDQDMMGEQLDYEVDVAGILQKLKVKPVGKDLNANSIIVYLPVPLKTARRLSERFREAFPRAEVSSRKVAFVCAIGSNIDGPGILAKLTASLTGAGIPILSIQSPLRGVDARFVIEEEHYAGAVSALHEAAIETQVTSRETAASELGTATTDKASRAA